MFRLVSRGRNSYEGQECAEGDNSVPEHGQYSWTIRMTDNGQSGTQPPDQEIA